MIVKTAGSFVALVGRRNITLQFLSFVHCTTANEETRLLMFLHVSTNILVTHLDTLSHHVLGFVAVQVVRLHVGLAHVGQLVGVELLDGVGCGVDPE